jgi:parallel beta-helix repeat protein
MGIARATPAVVALCAMVATSAATAQPIGPLAHRDAVRYAASSHGPGKRGSRPRARRTHGPLTSDRTYPIAAPGVIGTIYYVSAAGSDSNLGTSPAYAWKTVSRVDRARLAPGDGVLFQGGHTFGDQVLMPDSSGLPGRPIVYGSYGGGVATLPRGAWFVEHDLAFENLAFGATFYGGSDSKGASNDVTLDGVSISLSTGNQTLGLYSNGNHWVIENSTVRNTGLSGMLLNGDDYLVADNTIANTGLDATNGYNNHGIYLDASDTRITGNTIIDSSDSGISVRYRNSTIAGNTVSGAQIGIDFYETDETGGHSFWTDNSLLATTVASMFVCGTAEGCRQPLETFTIAGNKLTKSSGIYMNLQPSRGGYVRAANQMSQ